MASKTFSKKICILKSQIRNWCSNAIIKPTSFRNEVKCCFMHRRTWWTRKAIVRPSVPSVPSSVIIVVIISAIVVIRIVIVPIVTSRSAVRSAVRRIIRLALQPRFRGSRLVYAFVVLVIDERINDIHASIVISGLVVPHHQRQ